MSRQTEFDRRSQTDIQAGGPLPSHIAIIMDGNGRWARDRGFPRVKGHREGVISVRDIVEASAQLGVQFLTLYTFSTENWARPRTEVDALMRLLVKTLRAELATFQKNGIRLRAIGNRDLLPSSARETLEESIVDTAGNEGMTLVLALSYSGRAEIVDAVRRIAEASRDGTMETSEIDEAAVSQALHTRGIPDPELLIRTGGEYRISNFLLWQVAYAELYFTDVYWPAFRRPHLYEAIRDFQTRERRFGRVPQ